jgi:MYXO-CTERM domain-containing protein
MKFDTIVAASGAPASVQQIFVGKGRRLTVTGGTTYSVTVNCESNNVVSGTVTTPGGAAYALVAGDRGPWSFGVSSDAPADLAGFGLGNYTIKVWGADGIDKTYVVPLGGELPSDAPTYNLGCWSTITDSRPTISWGASADPNVNKVHLDLWAGDKDYGSGFADPSQTSLTPSEDLPNGFAMACVVFIDGEEYTFPDGAKYLSGLYSCADLGFNVVVLPGDANGDGVVDASDYIILKQHMGATTGAGASDGDFDKDGTVNWTDLQILMANFGQTQGADMPEPATLSLLALGGLAMIRRRR